MFEQFRSSARTKLQRAVSEVVEAADRRNADRTQQILDALALSRDELAEARGDDGEGQHDRRRDHDPLRRAGCGGALPCAAPDLALCLFDLSRVVGVYRFDARSGVGFGRGGGQRRAVGAGDGGCHGGGHGQGCAGVYGCEVAGGGAVKGQDATGEVGVHHCVYQ